MLTVAGSRPSPAVLRRPGRDVQGVVLIRTPNGPVGADFEYDIDFGRELANRVLGFHIHQGQTDGGCGNGAECGDVRTCTRGHWNPRQAPHGGPIGVNPGYDGDLGNLRTDRNGAARGTFRWPLNINDIRLRSFVAHAGEDDLTTDPTGGAGGRLACGTIEFIARPPRVAPQLRRQ